MPARMTAELTPEAPVLRVDVDPAAELLASGHYADDDSAGGDAQPGGELALRTLVRPAHEAQEPRRVREPRA